MGSLRSILVIAGKDIAQRSRDRSAYIMGVVGPLALALILSGTLGGADDPSAFQLGLAIEEEGSVAEGFRDVVAGLHAEGVVVITGAADRADPGAPVATDVAEAIAGSFAAELDYVTLATTSVLTAEGGAGDPEHVGELTSAALSQPPPIQLVPIETEAVVSISPPDGDTAKFPRSTGLQANSVNDA